MREVWVMFALLAANVASAKEVTLKWKAIEGAKTYNLQVSPDDNFSKKILEESVHKNSLPYDLKSGMYYLRVQGVDKLGRPGLWSKAFKLVVTSPVKPIEQNMTPQKLSFVSKAPPINSQWNATERATSYRVRVIKDGKEISTQETTSPNSGFVPTEPGDYKVEVSPGFGKYFGPSVVVQQVHLEKTNLGAPEWKMKVDQKYISRKPIVFNWTEVDNAKFYRLKISKLDPARTLASAGEPIHIHNTSDATFKIGTLPPGRYVASVEAHAGESDAAPSSNYYFDVGKGKPVEFDRLDFSARYMINQVNYVNSVIEAGTSNNSQSVGGAISLEGTAWFPESRFGVRLGGAWGGTNINNISIGYNDAQLGVAYKLFGFRDPLRTEIKTYMGARAWTMPLVVPFSGSNSAVTGIEILSPTIAGPMAGIDVTRPLSDRLAISGRFQASVPVTHSSIGSSGLATQMDTTLNSKVELGFKYAIPGSIRLVAMAGFQNDQFQYTAPTGPNGGTPPPGGKTGVLMYGATGTVGLEASDDGVSFMTTKATAKEKDRFSEFDVTARYVFSPSDYSANLQENAGTNSQNLSFSGATSGSIIFDMVGWLPDSKTGGRLSAAWGGFNYSGTTVSYPEFYAQWGLRSSTHPEKNQWILKNYLGVRSWEVPIVSIDGGNSNSGPGSSGQTSTTFLTQMPQFLGPADTLEISKGLGRDWTTKLDLEASSPFVVANRASVVDKIQPSALSYRMEISILKTFSEDLAAGIGGGYKQDQIRYTPSTASATQLAPSTVQLSAPLLSFFATYSF